MPNLDPNNAAQVLGSEDISGDRSSLRVWYEQFPLIYSYETAAGSNVWQPEQTASTGIQLLTFGDTDTSSANFVFSTTANLSLTSQLPGGFFTQDFYFTLMGLGFEIMGPAKAYALSPTTASSSSKVDLSATSVNINGVPFPNGTIRNDTKALTGDLWHAATDMAYVEFKQAGRKCASVLGGPDLYPAGVGLYEETTNGISAVNNFYRFRRPLVCQPQNVNGQGVRLNLIISQRAFVPADPSFAVPTDEETIALVVKAIFAGYVSDAQGNPVANDTESYVAEQLACRAC